MRQVVLYQDTDGVWISEVPSLPGCHSNGDSAEEALANVREAIEHWVEFAREKGLELPPDPGSARIERVEAA